MNKQYDASTAFEIQQEEKRVATFDNISHTVYDVMLLPSNQIYLTQKNHFYFLSEIIKNLHFNICI